LNQILKCQTSHFHYGSKIETTMDEQKHGNAWLVIDTQEDFVKFVDDKLA
jgi:hypothetical protein